MPLILPSNSISAGGYEVDNSLRFDDGSSDYLTKTFGTDGTSHDIKTVSVWLKRSELSAEQGIFTAGASLRDFIRFEATDELRVRLSNGSADLQTTQKFRDPSAWYHIVIAFDTTQGTASNRIKIYVNGSQITSFSTATYPSQNQDIKLGSAEANHIGNDSEQTNPYYDGYMSEFILIDGQALDPTSFGEFDADTGIWKPIDVSGLTFGNNGFYLPFENSGALGQDDSGNGNNWTVNNLTSIDQVTDTPTNNFATMNPLASQAGSNASSTTNTFSDGNLTVADTASETAIGNLGVDTGKWFWEVKVLTDQDGLAIGGANQYYHLDAELGYNSPSSPSDAKVFGYYGGNGTKFNTVGDGSQFTSYGSAIAVNDIIGVALDLDGNQVTFYKNGTSQGTFSITTLGSGEVYFPAVGNWSAATTTVTFNFGSPAFTISSGNSDANGYGNFEYAVPSGYYALCTANLAEFG
jgi:hypothetical protein